MDRPKKEVLLRKLVHALYENGTIDRTRDIVDIGAWLSDNAILWSIFLRAPGVVYAIDPAPDNIAFGKSVAEMNGRKNIKWAQCVCSDRAGVRLHYQGKLNHARFNSEGLGRASGLVTTTLDELVGEERWSAVGLMHVDVEGFEMNVLRGALQIIDASRPVVLFEQHISKENVMEIRDLLRSKGYQVYMINEVLPGCSLDCRNFIAVPDGLGIDDALKVDPQDGRDEDVWYATLGGALLQVP
jgi:FkbM family methyltransferase